MPLADLADSAHLQLVPSEPPLTETDAAALATQIDKLFAQFAREGRVGAWAIEALAGGAILAIAWEGEAELSGCSRDKVARLLLGHEERSSRRLISAPPIVVESGAGAVCVDRPGLRRLIDAGSVRADTPVYQLRCTSLAAWRRNATQPLAESPFAGLLVPGG